jgi:hypothetical protein
MSETDLAGTINAPPSNAGGVAARQGFKYQDHVAAFFVLTMIDDPRLAKVECETADDIFLFWQHGGTEYSEYVQVKTTEGDRKWTKDESPRAVHPRNQPPWLRNRFYATSMGPTRAFGSYRAAT